MHLVNEEGSASPMYLVLFGHILAPPAFSRSPCENIFALPLNQMGVILSRLALVFLSCCLFWSCFLRGS